MDILPELQDVMNSCINSYIRAVASRFNILVQDALTVWQEGMGPPEKLEVDYSALTCLQLKTICKERSMKIPSTLKKSELIALLKGELPIDSTKSEKVKSKKFQPSPSAKVISAIFGNCGSVVVRRNGFGNFEHKKTGFVFSNKSLKVIGKQLEDGTVADITKEDIELCNMWKFKFELPLNLNKDSNNLDSVAIDELKESDFEEEEEEDDEEDDDTGAD
jgi:hypothetical protein